MRNLKCEKLRVASRDSWALFFVRQIGSGAWFKSLVLREGSKLATWGKLSSLSEIVQESLR